MTKNTNTIKIQGQEYTISKLKLGDQIKLASKLAKTFKGMNLNPGDSNMDLNIDVGSILEYTPDLLIDILSIGLGIPREKVLELEDTSGALKAIDKIIKINNINLILKKSLNLLTNIM